MTREQKYETFRALHERPGAFVIPNPWDAGTARILTALGFEALATTSAGVAFSAGLRDSPKGLTRDQILENAKTMLEATHLPVSADLENGFGPSPASLCRGGRGCCVCSRNSGDRGYPTGLCFSFEAGERADGSEGRDFFRRRVSGIGCEAD